MGIFIFYFQLHQFSKNTNFWFFAIFLKKSLWYQKKTQNKTVHKGDRNSKKNILLTVDLYW